MADNSLTVPSLDGILNEPNEVSEGAKRQGESGCGSRQSEDGNNDQEHQTTPSMECIAYEGELTTLVPSLDGTLTQPKETSEAVDSHEESGSSQRCRKGSDLLVESNNGQEPDITPSMEDVQYHFKGKSTTDKRAQSPTVDDIGRTLKGLGVCSIEPPQTYREMAAARKPAGTGRPPSRGATSTKGLQSGNDKQQKAETTTEYTVVQGGETTLGVSDTRRGEAGNSSIMTDIKVMLDILSQSWSAIQQKFQDQPPPNNAPIFRTAFVKAIAANAKLLDLSPTEFCARFHPEKKKRHPISGVSSADTGKLSSIDSAVPGLSVESSQLIACASSAMDILNSTEKLKTQPILEQLRGMIKEEEGEKVKRIQDTKCGPPWGGPGPDWMTCGLDSCVVVAALLGIREGEPSDKTRFLRLAQYNWQNLQRAEAMNLKSQPFTWLIKKLNKDLPETDQLTAQSFLPLSRLLNAIFDGLPEITIRRRNKYHCWRCGTHWGKKVFETSFPSLSFGKPTLSAYFDYLFEVDREAVCYKCKSRATVEKVGYGNPPLNLCIQPMESEMPSGPDAPLSFIWVQPRGHSLRLTYSFTGAICCQDKRHFNVLWRAGVKQPGFLCYDGLIDDGRIKPVEWPGPDRDTWRDVPSAMFFVLTSTELHHDEDDASDDKAVPKATGETKSAVTKGKGKKLDTPKKAASRNKISRAKDDSRDKSFASSSANSSGTKIQPQKRKKEASGEDLADVRTKRPRTTSTQKAKTKDKRVGN
jgi:hypothetical protein